MWCGNKMFLLFMPSGLNGLYLCMQNFSFSLLVCSMRIMVNIHYCISSHLWPMWLKWLLIFLRGGDLFFYTYCFSKSYNWWDKCRSLCYKKYCSIVLGTTRNEASKSVRVSAELEQKTSDLVVKPPLGNRMYNLAHITMSFKSLDI